ncbi:MAG: hypothetical protein HZA22_02255 [Nitrospirae bacterium]|nr:hypothetical protein [Nitrospirota bacterium]
MFHGRSKGAWIFLIPSISFVLINVAALLILPLPPKSISSIRNQTYRRNWQHYTEKNEGKTQGEGTCVLIGNSQAYGRGYPDSAIYPRWMENEINKGKLLGYHKWKIENWAVAGGLLPEFEILAARAATQKPELVVLINRLNTVEDDEINKNITWFISDVPMLLADPDIKSIIPETFFERHVRISDILKIYIERYLPVLRMREFLIDNIFRKGLDLDWLMGSGWSGNEGNKWNSMRDEKNEARERKIKESLKKNISNHKKITLEYNDKVLVSYREIINICKSSGTPLIIIAMPIRRGRITNPGDNDKASEKLGILCAEYGVRYLDLSRVVPDEGFEGMNYMHFDEKHHMLFGRFLGRRLTEIMPNSTTIGPPSNVVQ